MIINPGSDENGKQPLKPEMTAAHFALLDHSEALVPWSVLIKPLPVAAESGELAPRSYQSRGGTLLHPRFTPSTLPLRVFNFHWCVAGAFLF